MPLQNEVIKLLIHNLKTISLTKDDDKSFLFSYVILLFKTSYQTCILTSTLGYHHK